MPVTKSKAITVIGWLHALLLCWGVYPFAARLLNLDGRDFRLFTLLGLLLILSVAGSSFLVKKLRFLALYWLCGPLLSCCFAGLAGILAWAGGLSFAMGSVPAGFFSLLLFLLRGQARIQKGRRKKELQELSASTPDQIDESAIAFSFFLDEPHPVQLLWFVVLYIAGALLKSAACWKMVFFLALADVFLCFLFQYLNGFHRYLKSRMQVANLPLSTMRKVVHIVLGCFLILLLLFAAPSLLYGKEYLAELKPVSADRQDDREIEELPVEAIENDNPMLDLLRQENENYEPPAWLSAVFWLLVYAVCILAAAALLLLLIRTLRQAGASFAAGTEDKITFLDSASSNPVAAFPGSKGSAEKLSANRRVRKIYKRTIRKAYKKNPARSLTAGNSPIPGNALTPQELEQTSGLAGNSATAFLHATYEKARYSKEGCSTEEAALLKRQIQ